MTADETTNRDGHATNETQLPDYASAATPWYVDRLPARILDDLDTILTSLLVSESADQYLERQVDRALGIALLVAVISTVLAFAFGTPFDAWTMLVSVIVGVIAGFSWLGGALAYPRIVLDTRRRAIERDLPHAILSLHALSQSGHDLTTAIETISTQETAGAVQPSFARIRDDIAWFDGELASALERRRDETPSEALAVFLDELLTVIQTGGDVPDFLATEVDVLFETAAERQERITQATATYAEGYVTLVFAAPIFLLVVLVVIGLVEPATRQIAAGVVYLAIPILLLLLALLFRLRVGSMVPRSGSTPAVASLLPEEPPEDADDLATRHHRIRRKRRLTTILRTPKRFFLESPRRLLVPSGVVAGVAAFGLARVLQLDAPLSNPLPLSGLVVTPLLLAILPFTIVYEHQRTVTGRVRGRVPAALHVIADGLDNGIPVTDIFGLAARRTTGRLATALRQIDRDIAWHASVSDALSRIRRRVSDQPTIRAVELVGNALQATHDLGDVIHTTARYVQDQHDLVEERRTQTWPYVVVVSIGVLVFLGIVALFDLFFLERIAALEPSAPSPRSTATQGLPRPRTVDVSAYRRLLYHATIIQAVGNGLVLGIVVDDRPTSGAKYVALFLAFTALTLAGLGLAH